MGLWERMEKAETVAVPQFLSTHPSVSTPPHTHLPQTTLMWSRINAGLKTSAGGWQRQS